MPPPDTFLRFNGPTPTLIPALPSACFLPWARQSLPNVCMPTKLFVRPRSARFDTSMFEGAGGVVPLYGSATQKNLDREMSVCFSGNRTGVTFEGPFLRYTVAKPPFDTWQGLHNNAVMTFFFDLYSERVIFLPFMGSLDIVGQYPGTWAFEVLMQPVQGGMPDPRMAALPTALDGDATLSLRVAGATAGPDSFREFEAIPPGAHSFTVNSTSMGVAGTFPTADIWQDDTHTYRSIVGPTGDPLNTSVPITLYGGVSSAFMNRVGHHNAYGLNVNLQAINDDGMVQWHLGWT